MKPIKSIVVKYKNNESPKVNETRFVKKVYRLRFAMIYMPIKKEESTKNNCTKREIALPYE